ncbi:T3SS effector HopA1 family protein [Streptomyces sp. NPDC048506]|uniref:T3SS effector HopA1 family protein n=1 Tax=Streptomyces sp. NPDC048506 TaxID=3155028 RepID=UPI00343F59BB
MRQEHLALADKIAALLDDVTVADGGLRAETAGEVYEAETQQALARELGAVLYQTLHTGRDKPLDITVRSWRDRAFDAALDEATGPRTMSVAGRLIGADEDHAIVEFDGVRVRTGHQAIADRSDDRAKVVLPSARPGLSPGFFLATSSGSASTGPLLRLYGRLDDPDAAPAVWRELVTFLEGAGIPWRAKISSSRLLYPRNDAVVVYLTRPGWRVARDCAELLQATGLLGEGTSPFTQAVTASVGCAFEPDDPRPSRREMSFGQHRAQVFADALVEHAALPHGEREPVAEVVAAAFIDAGIDPSEPARNLSSPIVNVLQNF